SRAVLAERADEGVPPSATLDAQPGQVPLHVGASDEGGGQALRECRRVEVIEGLGDGERRHRGERRDQPANTEAGQPELRAAALVDDETGPIEGLERRGRLLLEIE